jgi:hypothetical protein
MVPLRVRVLVLVAILVLLMLVMFGDGLASACAMHQQIKGSPC